MNVIEPAKADNAIRAVGAELLERCVRQGRSLFTPERRVWDRATVEELYRRYNGSPDTSQGSFMAKLRRQVENATDSAIQLTAELLLLHGLPLSNMSAERKSQRVAEVLGWMSQPARRPRTLTAAFEQRTWNGGIGAHTMTWRWLADALEFLRDWWRLPETERERAYADPWAWRELIHRYKMMPSLREELLYLRFPTHFLPIINVEHKRAIRETFAGITGVIPSENLDRDLFEITLRLQRKVGQPVDYYREPFLQQWKKSVPSADQRRAWLIRPDSDSLDQVRQWRDDAFVSLTAPQLGPVGPGATQEEVWAALATGHEQLPYLAQAALANACHAFLSQIQAEDVVVTVVGDQLHLGSVDHGEPERVGPQLRRPVGWLPSGPIALGGLPASVRGKLRQPGIVTELTASLKALTALIDVEDTELDEMIGSIMSSPDDTAGPEIPVEPAAPRLPAITEDLARGLHVERDWLQRIADLLARRRQIIFYGPPGTGKTFIARRLAEHLAGREAVQLVQFHPSYAYEDFFEGFRPTDGDGTVGVRLAKVWGPLRRLAARAAADPIRPYVLVIDEINRANLAKVFGELYYLLEYRDETIRLQYSPDEEFRLPPNLYIIGTMNAADRSIALIDAAIRRRFAFVELHPELPPVRDVLLRWLAATGRPEDERAGLLTALNAAIGESDHDFKIGPSYLMKPDLDDPEALAETWSYEILPLLEEHYYGRLTRAQVHQRFGLAAIRRAAGSGSDG
jgi:5-methylcytosine-specific restriction protein B